MNMQIIIDTGAINEIKDLYLDRRALVLIYSLDNQSLIEKLSGLLGERLIRFVAINESLPSVEYVSAMRNQIWQSLHRDTTFILAIGGGTVLDTAKVVRFSPSIGIELDEELDAPVKSNRNPIPLVLCPTTSGTGSEVSSTATLWNFSKGSKHSFFGPTVVGDIALIDPELTMTLGPIETRNAAIDALSHALESIWNKNRNDETLRLAIEAARLIVNALPIVLNNLQSLRAREKLSIGSLRAGQAMSVTQTSLAHALSYEDTLSLRLPHGEAVGRWLPVVYHNALSSDKTAARALSEALESSITSAKEFALWLESMGLRTVNPYQSNPTIQNRMTQALLSTRGQTFSGKLHFG